MRNWVIFAVIIGLLSFLIICEIQINSNYFPESTGIINEAKLKISNGILPSDEIDEMKNLWNKRKKPFFIFYSHNILNNIEDNLSKISVAAEIKDKEMMGYLIDELKNLNDMFKNYHKLKIGNVF